NNQIVFYSFDLNGLDNSAEDRDHLVMNSLTYLGVWSPGGMGTLSGTANVDAVGTAGIEISVNNGAYTATTAGDGSYSIELYPGFYTVTATSDTYYPFVLTVDSVEITSETTTTQDFAFETVINGAIRGAVTLEGTTDYSGVEVSIPALELSVVTGEDGSYEIVGVAPGAGIAIAVKEGYGTGVEEYFLPNNDTLTVDFNLAIGYEEDFEATNGGYTEDGSLWAHGEPSAAIGAYSGVNVWATNLTGEYPSSANASLYSVPIFLDHEQVTLKFYQWHEFEGSSTHYDGGNVKISTDGGSTWSLITPEGGYGGTISSGNVAIPGEAAFVYENMTWHEVEFDLSAYNGEEVIIRWHFGSDGSVTRDGWYIDDVRVEFAGTVGIDVPLNVTYTNQLLHNYPNPFNPTTSIPFTLQKGIDVEMVIYNMLGQKVRTYNLGKLDAGSHSVNWDAKDSAGKLVSSGI
ncbi:MAG: immune inhibitor A, partial [Calditrichia bacterium]|nr:immune inhibitor A [Calditrichia bacterium]